MSDDVERALDSLRRREHPRAGRDAPVDATVALALQRRDAAALRRRPRYLQAAALVLLAAAGLGAATHADALRRWLVVIHVFEDDVLSKGAPVEELPSDGDGRAFRVDLGEGSAAEIQVREPEGGVGAERRVEVELDGEGRGPGRIEIHRAKEPGRPKTDNDRDSDDDNEREGGR